MTQDLDVFVARLDLQSGGSRSPWARNTRYALDRY